MRAKLARKESFDRILHTEKDSLTDYLDKSFDEFVSSEMYNGLPEDKRRAFTTNYRLIRAVVVDVKDIQDKEV